MYDRYRNVIGIFLNQLSGKEFTVFGDGDQTEIQLYYRRCETHCAGGIRTFAAGHVFNVGGDITTVEAGAVTMDAWGNSGVDVSLIRGMVRRR